MGIEPFKSLLVESRQLNRLRLMGDVVRPAELKVAFRRDDQAPQPISLPALNTLSISNYSTPQQLNFTLRLIHAPNLKNLQLTNLNFVLWGSTIDFAPTFEFLGTSTFSSFERLEALELRRVSCHSGAAWDLFCAKLTNLRQINLSYMPTIPAEYTDGFSGYLNSLALPLGGNVVEGEELRCPNLRSLCVSGSSQDTVMGVVQKRLRARCGISRVIYRDNNPPDGIIDDLAKLGVEGRWGFDRDSEAGSDSGLDGN
ncbi:hypothetical protein FS837_010055 [Tulasnella sp. UAMH 9824]|nr:hypothetical protein FS837_010055 [Tulasnella sp. UAMH 9824]